MHSVWCSFFVLLSGSALCFLFGLFLRTELELAVELELDRDESERELVRVGVRVKFRDEEWATPLFT